MELELLNYIYQNAKMGIVGIDNIKHVIKDDAFLKTIREQERDYYALCNEATTLLLERNESVKDISGMAKIMTYIDAKMKTNENTTTSDLAKMMMKGSNRGIIEIQEKLNKYDEADKKVVRLAKNLLKVEKRNLDNLKKFL